MRNITIRNILPLLLPVALFAACLGQESGIDNRHILGVAIIPPLDYVEIEAGDESANNTVEGAEFVDYVGYRYVVIQGALVAGSDASDTDVYQFTSGLDGEVTFTLSWTEDQFTDMDIYQLDVAGAQVQAAEGSLGFETFTVEVEEEGEVFVEVAAKGLADGYDGSYTLVMRGIEPNEQGEPEDDDYWAGMDPVLVGAYVSSDVDNLGNPVSGTSILEWNDDPETYQHWATFDMYIVQSVEVIADVFVDPELEDGKDNNCDGLTDRGISENDTDGDGARVADGDCDDNDPTVRPGWPDNHGDGVDGDCDGWADNGLDGIDDDGDGQSEYDGDCNDTDPHIYSTLLNEIEMGDDLGADLLPDGKDNNCDAHLDNDPSIGDDDDSAGTAPPAWPTRTATTPTRPSIRAPRTSAASTTATARTTTATPTVPVCSTTASTRTSSTTAPTAAALPSSRWASTSRIPTWPTTRTVTATPRSSVTATTPTPTSLPVTTS